MQQIMIRLEDRQSWKDSLRRCCRVNKLTIELASAYTPLRFRAAYARFKAIYQRRTEDRAERWLQNQLKAFQWFVVSLSLVTDILIRNFDQKQMQVLNNVFYFKQPMTLLYEVRKLSEDPTCKNSWVSQQEALLKDIVLGQSDCSNRWNEFARKLYENSQRKYFRTGKQCRQKWLNHLDPNKRHGQWTESQDMEVAKLFLSDGRKWSQVSRKMGGSRTQHMVKNRYKTILSRQKKLYPQVKNEYSLLKTFVFPDYAKKYSNRAIAQGQQKKQRLENVENSQQRQVQKVQIKDQHKSAEEYKPKMKQEEIHHQEDEYHPENIEELQRIVREEERPELKIPAASSSGYQTMPQVFSPWYMGYPITPTFSPFYVNVSTFSAFDANINNQFYAPNRQSERSDQF